EISGHDDLTVGLKRNRKTQRIGGAEGGSHFSAITKCCVGRAARIIASQREASNYSCSSDISDDDEFAIDLNHRGTSSRSSVKGRPDLAAVTITLVKASIGVKASKRKIVEITAVAGAGLSNHDDFAVRLQHDRVPFGCRVAEVESNTAAIAERPVETAVRIK